MSEMSNTISRRSLLSAAAGSAAALSVQSEAQPLVRSVKPKDLSKRGEPEICRGQELDFIGMPVGGFFAGTVYLGGDGQLWNWDIFNQPHTGALENPGVRFMGENVGETGGANYVSPLKQTSPFRQRFEFLVNDGLYGNEYRNLQFGDVAFRGEYPVGKVSYRQANADVEMEVEAFSPFVPLDAEASSWPATTQTYRVKNTGKNTIKVQLQYAFENPCLTYAKKTRRDFTLATDEIPGAGLICGSGLLPFNPNGRPDILFADWSDGTYGAWKAEGKSFGDSPRRTKELPSYMGPVNCPGEFVVNTHNNRGGLDVVQADTLTGTLTSPEFTIEREFINFRIGGGAHKGRTCLNLVIDGKVVHSETGRNSNVMFFSNFDVTAFKGKKARLIVVDSETGGWGQISLGEVVFSDVPKFDRPLLEYGDFGEFGVVVLGGASEIKKGEMNVVNKEVELAPGETKEVTFLIAWHFPNVYGGMPEAKRWYSAKWFGVREVLKDLSAQFEDLATKTRLWNQTWYDSTLPHWFLDRTFLNLSILATNTCYRFASGRYWFWEGIGCCAGTCTHVWGYAQGIGRVFPEIEKYLRSEIDYGLAFREASGAIDYRAEYHQIVAHDGHCGCILRAYREHLMSRDMSFLKSKWPRIKKSIELLMKEPGGPDGLLTGAQYNTLDAAWYGPMAWLSSLYLAALRSGEAMAVEMKDTVFASQCKSIIEKGSKQIVKDLFNGEYFIHKPDPKHPEANSTNDGCHIDQVYGQAWAMQVGLPRVMPQTETIKALKSLYRYSFVPDVWEYRRKVRGVRGGRWYAVPGEAGLIMCTFPHGGDDRATGKGGDAWAAMYFNECMSGFEHQVAAHMIFEGLVKEGLDVLYAIHERYQPAKRNPYNEVECSDHYGRALAAYGAFVAITGFWCHGPSGKMGFAPKLKGRFRCPFIAADGWGTYERSADGKESVEYRERVGG